MPEEKKTRCFIAADIPGAVKEEIAILTSSLKKRGPEMRWVSAENLHLTLKFLGHLSDERLSGTKTFLSKISSEENRFTIHLSGLGGFPSTGRPRRLCRGTPLEAVDSLVAGRPRVVWVGVDAGAEALENLAEKIEQEAGKAGFEREERVFSAHLTIGRAKEPTSRELVDAIQRTAFSSAHQISVDHLTLYKSTLTGKGAVYEPIEVFNFLSREAINKGRDL